MSVSIDLTGKSAIVTGSGRGIGRETALLLAKAGACLTIADVDETTAAGVAQEIRAMGGAAAHVRTDITSAEDAKKMVRAAIDAHGRVDILVNNAARWTTKLFKDITPEEYDVDIRVTLYGTLNASRAVLDPMMEQKYGRIVNLISDAGRIGEPYLSIYSAAKGGVAAFTKALAKEVGRYSITVNGVAPGVTHTPGAQGFIDSAGGDEKLARAYPLRRLGQPIDIANAILFLASDLSSYMTGQIFSVDGGYSTPG
ncbi:MAG: SDR family oxidoreductase [Chloroflexi bacterium]|nr:SDR family oxidoreductase [Chloroflexota bacterium]MCL5951983.1 SDR family oxidoreductase [Chloroflexota bacterium]